MMSFVIVLLLIIPGEKGIVKVTNVSPYSIEFYPSVDTCMSQFSFPLYYYEENWQTECEATYCEGAASFFPWRFYIMWYNYDTSNSHSKEVTLYIWEDAGGVPGNVLWQKTVNTGFLSPQQSLLVEYEIDTVINIEGSIWFGHRENIPGPPTSLLDLVPQVPNKYSRTCNNNWFDDLDHFQILTYSEVPPVGVDISEEIKPLSLVISEGKILIKSDALLGVNVYRVSGERAEAFVVKKDCDIYEVLINGATGIYFVKITSNRGAKLITFLKIK